MPTSVKPRGRPRDPTIDAAVLEATRRLLEETGFDGTTVQAVSRRSGVHPPAIYRRWPSRIALIEDAAFADLTEVVVVPTGDLGADLRRFVRAYHRTLDSPAARAAMPGLLAAAQQQPDPPPSRWMHLSVRPQFAAILAAAPEEVDPDVDIDEVFELLLAAMLARLVIPPISTRRRPIDRLVTLILRTLRPAAS